MKNQIAIGALTFGAIFLGTNNVQAQLTPALTSTAESTVNIRLGDVITIDPSSIATTKSIDFEYTTAAHYNAVQTKTVSDALKVTSTQPFGITVKANGPDFENTAAFSKIPVGVMTINAIDGTMTGSRVGGTLSEKTAVALVAGAALGSELTVGLVFEISAANAKSTDILGKPAGTYTQKVTYTATTN